eukprot:2515727-Amphidinium_carterae.1
MAATWAQGVLRHAVKHPLHDARGYLLTKGNRQPERQSKPTPSTLVRPRNPGGCLNQICANLQEYVCHVKSRSSASPRHL